MAKAIKDVDVLLILLGVFALVLNFHFLNSMETKKKFYDKYDTKYIASVHDKFVDGNSASLTLDLDLADRVLRVKVKNASLKSKVGEQITVFANRADLSDLVIDKPNFEFISFLKVSLIVIGASFFSLIFYKAIAFYKKGILAVRKTSKNTHEEYKDILVCFESLKGVKNSGRNIK